MKNEFDWDYYEKYHDEIISGIHFDNNYTCWRILSHNCTDDLITNTYLQRIDCLKGLLKCFFDANRMAFTNLILMIEYFEWLLYLNKVYNFMANGIKLHKLSANATIETLNIDQFIRNFVALKYFYGRPSHVAETLLDYSDNYKNFTVLNIGLALEKGEYISFALANGCNQYQHTEYHVPDKNWGFDDINQGIIKGMNHYFLTHITHESLYKLYLTREEEKQKLKQGHTITSDDASSKQVGIYNLLTGEIVKPRDGTYYIDDFIG